MSAPVSFNKIFESFEVPAGGTYNLEVDLKDTLAPQFMIKQTYSATGSPTGCNLTIYPGFSVDRTGTIEYADNGTAISEMQDPTASQGSTQITRSAFSLDREAYPRNNKFKFENTDTVNKCTINLYGDY